MEYLTCQKNLKSKNLITLWTDSQNALKMHFTGTLYRNYMLKLCDLLVVLELLSESFMPVIIESFFCFFLNHKIWRSKIHNNLYFTDSRRPRQVMWLTQGHIAVNSSKTEKRILLLG